MTDFDIKEKEEIGKTCRDIGSTVVGLYYLSTEAKKSHIEGLASIIDTAITNAIELGCTKYEHKLKAEFQSELHAFIDEACVFIDRYCAISDPVAKRALANIVRGIGSAPPAKHAHAG